MNPEGKDSPLIRGTKPELQEAARALRQPMTSAEQMLWQALRNRKLGGFKFRRQHAVGPFILDFYCSACKLAVELDGQVHTQRTEYDRERTAHLNAYGCRVIRFDNEEVLGDLPSVLARILRAATG